MEKEGGLFAFPSCLFFFARVSHFSFSAVAIYFFLVPSSFLILLSPFFPAGFP
jgi:hypothetical protein